MFSLNQWEVYMMLILQQMLQLLDELVAVAHHLSDNAELNTWRTFAN